jgi:hypothetical protein
MARAAYSLNILLQQLNNHAPNRSKLSDGGIGDDEHASRASDHNPDANGVYHARDFTDDPHGGLDCHWLANQLVKYRDPRLKYLIWSGYIYSNVNGTAPWAWRRYTGPNPHTKHMHISVYSHNGDDRTLWRFYEITIPQNGDEVSVIFAKGPDAPLTCKVEFATGANGVIAYRTTVPNPNEPGFKLWLKAGNKVIVTDTQADFDNIPYKPGTPGAAR